MRSYVVSFHARFNVFLATCSPGTYGAAANSTACLGAALRLLVLTPLCISACPIGRTSLFGASTCSDCSTGKFSNTSQQAPCSLCAPGSFASYSGVTVCILCPTGTFAAGKGTVSCTRTFVALRCCKRLLNTECPG